MMKSLGRWFWVVGLMVLVSACGTDSSDTGTEQTTESDSQSQVQSDSNATEADGVVVMNSVGGVVQTGTSIAYEPGSRFCSSLFVAEWNELQWVLRAMKTMFDVKLARNQIIEFKYKYLNVSCVASVTDQSTGISRDKTVDVNSEMERLLALIDKAVQESEVTVE